LLGVPLVPETIADPLSPSRDPLFFDGGIIESQRLGPDLSSWSVRDTRGRFAKGSSGNPSGRPRGIRNPRRRIPDLVARPLSVQALSSLLDRKPHLLRPLALQLLPPPLVAVDPAARFYKDLSSASTLEDFRRVLANVLAAIARGEVTPAAGARVAERVKARLRAIRQLGSVGRVSSGKRRG
jgi:Family of unknown function (DUF5681)